MTRFAVIIPTLQEGSRLPATLAAARTAFGQDAEYIVSDGGSTDDTCVIARKLGTRLIVGGAGRGYQLERGFRAANCEVCLFLHADTLLPANACTAIEHALKDREVAGGAFTLEFGEPAARRLVLRLHQGAINLRARLLGNATGDHAMFVRSAVLAGIGGVPRVPLFEDVRLCRAIKRAGRFVLLRERVITSARLWQRVGPVRGILLHWLFRLLHALGASPAFLARHYPLPR